MEWDCAAIGSGFETIFEMKIGNVPCSEILKRKLAPFLWGNAKRFWKQSGKIYLTNECVCDIMKPETLSNSSPLSCLPRRSLFVFDRSVISITNKRRHFTYSPHKKMVAPMKFKATIMKFFWCSFFTSHPSLWCNCTSPCHFSARSLP